MRPFFISVPAFEQLPAHRLAAYAWGDAQAPCIMCVHGLTRNARDFDRLAERLAGRFHVIAISMAGRGESDALPRPELYQSPTYLYAIAQALAQLGISQLHGVGTSMGGILGMMLAATRPGLLRSLVLNDVGAMIPAASLQRIALYAGAGPFEFTSRAQAEEKLRQNCASFGITLEEDWQHLFLHSIVRSAAGGFRLAYDPAIMQAFSAPQALAQDVQLWPLWEACKALPVLLVRGAQSDLFLKDTAQQMLVMHERATLLEIAGAGHAPALMRSDEIEPIAKWLEAQA